MNYADMWAAGEATPVLVKLQESTRRIWGGEKDAHSILISWGELIRTRFKSDNLPITSRLQHYPDMKPVVDMVSGLSSNYLALQQSTMATNARQYAREKAILEQLAAIRTDQAAIMQQNAKILQSAAPALYIDKGKGSADTNILSPSPASVNPMSPPSLSQGASGP